MFLITRATTVIDELERAGKQSWDLLRCFVVSGAVRLLLWNLDDRDSTHLEEITAR